MFENGTRMRPWTAKDLLPTSGKLIPEFDRRRSIKDMFSRTVSLPRAPITVKDKKDDETSSTSQDLPDILQKTSTLAKAESSFSKPVAQNKRSASKQAAPQAKRMKTPATSSARESSGGQQSLKGFFAPKDTKPAPQAGGLDGAQESMDRSWKGAVGLGDGSQPQTPKEPGPLDLTAPSERSEEDTSEKVVDPIVAKESWGRLFVKPAAPNCEHDEPCKTMLTKKSGVNCGRSFWMCARPLGPTGNKEKGTQWRCSTFIWASDWNGGG